MTGGNIPGAGGRWSPDVKVEIFSDVVCPWCAIGKRRFERALDLFEHAEVVEVVWRSFELDPRAPAVEHADLAEHLAAKYGMSLAEARASQERLTRMAGEEGLDFHFERASRANTFDAHRLLHFAREQGLQGELKGRLLSAYFSEGAVVSDHAELVRLAEEVGLDGGEAAEVLSSGMYGDQVRADEAEARELGVNGVPFFVIDRRYGISGAQSTQTVLGALREAWSASHPALEAVGAGGGAACEDGSCAI